MLTAGISQVSEYIHLTCQRAYFTAGSGALKQLVSSLLQSCGGLVSVGFYYARSYGMYSTLQEYAFTVPPYNFISPFFYIFPAFVLMFLPYIV